MGQDPKAHCLNCFQSLSDLLISLDKLASTIDLPTAKTSEIHPVSGKTIALRVKATKDVSITLHEKPQTDSARYRFLIFNNAGNSVIYRSTEGGSEILKHSASTPNVLGGADPQWRTIWIDFRSSNLVLGSGAEALLQWTDPSPISVSYVSFTADPTKATSIVFINRQIESELTFFLTVSPQTCIKRIPLENAQVSAQYIWVIGRACSVKMVEYWPCSFSTHLLINMQKRGQCPPMST